MYALKHDQGQHDRLSLQKEFDNCPKQTCAKRNFHLAKLYCPLDTWHTAENPRRRTDQIAALRLRLGLGLTLIDTAEM
jgi:hypothetical protein